jgi:SAM-dependent methyltransferase
MTHHDLSPASGPQPTDYDERYYRTGLGLPYDESEPHWARFFGMIADHIIAQLAPRTALDAGCAKGFLVAALAERGVDASGVDISEYAIKEAAAGARDRVSVHSLTEPLAGRWDVVICIEVLEHMSPADTQIAIDNICAVTDRVLLSSTPHDFAEPSHVNVRPVSTWAQWFANRGFFRRTDLDLSYLSPWAVVFERRSLTPADVAYLYEVELAPLREEMITKQVLLLEADRRIGELSAEAETARNAEDAVPAYEHELRHDVDRVLSLVDQVIGLQAEIAEERYRHDLALWAAAEAADAERKRLLAHAALADERVTNLVQSRTWRIGHAVLGPPHRLRRLLRRS